MGAKESKKTANDGVFQKIVALEYDGYPMINVPPDVTLTDLLKMWEDDGKPENYKTCVTNLQKLVEVQNRALTMKVRRGEKYGKPIGDWIAAAQLVTNTIPIFSTSNKAEYGKSKKVISYYNEIMKRRANDFEKFAGSLKPVVVSKAVIDEAIKKAATQIKDLEMEKKGESSDENILLEAALTVADTLPRLVSLGEKFVDNVDNT